MFSPICFIGLSFFDNGFFWWPFPDAEPVILDSAVSQDTINNMNAIVGVLYEAGISNDLIKEIALTLPTICESGIGIDIINELLVDLGINDLSIGLDQIDLLKFFNALKLLAQLKDEMNLNSNQKEILSILTGVLK